MAENIISNEVNVHDGVSVTNWISQINAGGTVYDIATHHGITFKDGNGGTSTVWNGLTDIEVVIPSITDMVQTPIEFAGTVAGGKVEWNAAHTDGPKTGYLVFVTENCEFEGHACEAGDMAIYDGVKWNIVSGENQVKIVGSTDSTIADGNRTVVKVGAAKDVLVVEGKALSLTLDYTDLNDNHLSVTTGVSDAAVLFDTMTVGSVDIKLNKADDTMTIGSVKDFQRATALKDGKVTLENATGLVNGITWGKFDAGTQTISEKNSAQELTVSGGKLNKTITGASEGAFVDYVSLSDVVKFEGANTDEDGSIKMLTTLTSAAGDQQFFNGIHRTKSDETADLTIEGYVAPIKTDVKFVEGLEENLTPVTSITSGGFKLVEGTALATGFGSESTTGDVVSSVTVNYNNNTSVLNEAKVENHVLSFGATNVTSNVSSSCGYKSLTKTGFEYTAPVATNTSFVTSGFAKVDNVDYTFGKGNETVYSAETKNWKISTPKLNVTYGSYGFSADDMKATVPAQTFVTSVTAGQLPSLTDSTFTTTTVTGTVGTELTTEKYEFNALNANSINIPAYTLSRVESGTEGAITVGKAGVLAANVAHIDLSEYLTSVAIV